MIITRKIQVYVYDKDATEKKEYIHTLYTWRDYVRKAANAIVAHKFVQQNIRDFVYIKDEIKEKFYVKDIINDGKGMSEQNTTYRLCSDMLKGKVPSDIFSCLNQAVAHTFKETEKDMLMGKASLRSYRNNIPIPFSAKALSNIHWDADDKRFYFTLFGVPFAVALGRDRSNNQSVIERAINGEYKLCSSSLQIDDDANKMFILFCVDIPQKEMKLKEGKVLYAYLGIMNPIIYVADIKAKNESDSGYKVFEIGTKEEFNYRRRQIQEAERRCQIECRYSVGGKGRKRKIQALDRFKDKENNYVDTKLHTYSRMLVDAAVKNECSTICLMRQTPREILAKQQNADGDDFILRNWSYFGLKTKIAYKAKMYGIAMEEEKAKDNENEAI